MALSQRSSPTALATRRHPSKMNRSPHNRPNYRYAVPRKTPQEKVPELLVMIGVNVAIASVAGLTIFRLLPYNESQQIKLQSLEAEVNALDHRVDNLRDDFNNYFDPQQSRNNIRTLSDRLEPGQRNLVLIEPPTAPETSVDGEIIDPASTINGPQP